MILLYYMFQIILNTYVAKLSPNFSLAGLGLVLTPIPPAPTHPPDQTSSEMANSLIPNQA